MNNSYTILINSCDNFEDCWYPFFKLFSIYWPDYKGKIYLNTEYKDFSYPGLDIICTKVCERNHYPRNKRATWSQCLKWALEQIDTDIMLYMQEDYFLKDAVKNHIVEKFAALIQQNHDVKCIHLTDQAVKSSGKSIYEDLNIVKYKQRYRISCQAALWNKSELLELIREYEDAWEFEEFGSMRSAIFKSNYLVVDKEYVKLNKFEIIPYIFTGIIQGRWFEETVPLFDKHGIIVDFTRRGFVKDAPSKPFMRRVQYRLDKIPKIIRNTIALTLLRNT